MNKIIAILSAAILMTGGAAHAWWDGEWSARKKVTIDTTAEGVPIKDAIGTTAVLLRLHGGNFDFMAGKEDGSDIRVIAEDDKTPLPFAVEKFDSLMGEGFVWVQVPDVKPGAQTSFWVYYGNPNDAEKPEDKPLYDADTLIVYHLGENGAPAVDASGLKNNSENAGTTNPGSLIGTGLRFLGSNKVKIPVSESLAFTEGGALTWSAWIKPTSLAANAVVFSRKENGNGFVIGLDSGVPYVEVTNASGVQRSAPGAPMATGVWRNLAVVAEGGLITIYLDGENYSTLQAAVPALNSVSVLGGDESETPGFIGELDEVQISRIARPAGAIKFAAIGQGGTEAAGKLLVEGEPEASGGGGGHAMEHLMLFGDIANNMMFDGWVVIFCCAIMAIVGWTVAIKKFLYLNSIQKGGEEFLAQWSHVANDLTALDHSDPDNVKSVGGKADAKTQKLMHASPLYHIYHIGSEEIRHRLQKRGGFAGLSARSIQAIRASLDAGLTREVHKLNGGMIFLTISIAGGPYVGLLGTVMGVMITFAVIAKSGEVEVNSIAPGIASALLATVAGLIVAIPALFIYSYLSSRIKNTVSSINVFIDEFVTKMAEFYPETPANPVPVQHITIDKS